jgi:preprotein translocase subunit SecD
VTPKLLRFCVSAAAACLLLALLAACGGEEAPPRAELTLQADLSAVAEGADPADALADLEQRLEQRLTAWGAQNIAVSVGDDGVVTVAADGIDRETALRLLTTRANLEFMRVEVDARGLVHCRTADGQDFGVPPNQVNPDEASGRASRCFSSTLIGDPVWIPIEAEGPDGTVRRLTVELVEPGGWELPANQPGALAIQFNEEGAELVDVLTTNFRGYPLGLFVDGELRAAPRINNPVTNGRPIFSGFSPEEARLLYAQFSSRPLPLPVAEAPSGAE